MAADRKHRQDHPPTVGPRANPLSVVSLALLGAFVLIVAVLLVADLLYLVGRGVTLGDFWRILTSAEVAAAVRLSLITSLVTLVLVMIFAVPIGYALSRYRFFGHSLPGKIIHALLDTIVDVPIVLPPVVIGLSLLAFFGTPIGGMIKAALSKGDWTLVSGIGIVLCQFLVSISYCIRATKASFDSVDRSLEHVALSLGCSQWGAFRRVTLPLARSGLVAGGIMAWARAIGVFGPLMVFVGTSPRVQVMPTTMWLELSIGDIETSLVVALLAVLMAGAALAVVHWLLPGKKWT